MVFLGGFSQTGEVYYNGEGGWGGTQRLGPTLTGLCIHDLPPQMVSFWLPLDFQSPPRGPVEGEGHSKGPKVICDGRGL